MLLNFRLAALAALGSLLKFQIFRPHPRPTELKRLGAGPGISVLTISMLFLCLLKLESTGEDHGLYMKSETVSHSVGSDSL